MVVDAIKSSTFEPLITEIFCTTDPGPSIFAFRWAMENKKPIRRFKPEWDKLGKMAGMVMNAEMCTYADALIVLTDGRDWPTQHIIQYSLKMDPPLKRFIVNVGVQKETLQDYGRQISTPSTST